MIGHMLGLNRYIMESEIGKKMGILPSDNEVYE